MHHVQRAAAVLVDFADNILARQEIAFCRGDHHRANPRLGDGLLRDAGNHKARRPAQIDAPIAGGAVREGNVGSDRIQPFLLRRQPIPVGKVIVVAKVVTCRVKRQIRRRAVRDADVPNIERPRTVSLSA